MCGRYTLRSDPRQVALAFELAEPMELAPRYNIAPSQEVAAVRLGSDGRRRLDMLRWGLVPSWADDPSIGNKLINARGETVATKPAFRRACRDQRCLIVADGFYEWQTGPEGKQPYLLALASGAAFAMAGLWERWERDGLRRETCAMITTTANEMMAEIHHRMPVILRAVDYDRWLGPGALPGPVLERLLAAYPADEMVARRVSKHVNNPRHDDPQCAAPLTVE
jgi:putative SOS response-associated peptidase YedK